MTENNGYLPEADFEGDSPYELAEESLNAQSEGADFSDAYYRRPAEEEDHDYGGQPFSEERAAFVPPPRFRAKVELALPDTQDRKPAGFAYGNAYQAEAPQSNEGGEIEPESDMAYSPPGFSYGNVYQPKSAHWAEDGLGKDRALGQAEYQVEAERATPEQEVHRSSKKKILLAVVAGLVLLGGALYLERDWVMGRVSGLLGSEPAVVEKAPDVPVQRSAPQGYDPAPAVKLNEKAQGGIAAISRGMDMEVYAVTASHVVTRVETGAGQYDFYLFSGTEGQLLGYYEGLSESGLLVQPEDSFYVEQAPYLINRQGKPVFDVSLYSQYVGENPVLSPFENGWALISDPKGARFNYINREGGLIDTLWFARVFPFYGSYTAAYVDTGNMAKPEERYILYVLNVNGEMKKWKSTGNMQEVVGVACDMALLQTGELISLKDTSEAVCRTESVSAYLDCGALVARDLQTGRYGLFVKGEAQYDFSYDSIEPVPCDIQWKREDAPGFGYYAVTGLTYPLPLSHYFSLRKDGVETLVALSTRSVYPIFVEGY